jgi:histidinol-phosphate aminotransferase
MGFLSYYRQFEAMPEEEINARLREEAQERKRKALAVVEPIDLSQTTWPEYPPPTVVNAITYAARRGLHRYLDRHAAELRLELAHRHGVDEARLVVGDGAARMLSDAAQALLEPGDGLITPWPSYGLYPVMARRARGHAVPVRGFGAEPVLAAVNDRTRLVALCNPNDPTGELLRVGELRALLEALPERVVVLLDEALRDFVDAEERDAALALLEDHPRLLVFRTFSKAWGLAGLRCGYVLGGPGAEPLLERLEPELGLNELAQAGVLEALRHAEALVARRAAGVAAERGRLLGALRERPVRASPSQANVVWLRADGLEGAELAHRLQHSGVIVRAGGPLGDPAHVRVTVRDAEATDRFLRALDSALRVRA